MAEWIWAKVRPKGLFSGVKVCIEVKFLSPLPDGETQGMILYRDKDSALLGKLEYEQRGTDSRITVFTMQEWSSQKYAECLMKECLTQLKKKKVKVIRVELYDTDNTTPQKLTLYRNMGFAIESGGNVTGYNQYHLIKHI
jgi:hypothetical protein